MHKVCHITSVHSWRDVRIFEKECQSLARAGFDVSFIAPDAKPGFNQGVNLLTPGARPASRLERMTTYANKLRDQALSLEAEVYHIHDPELLRIGWHLVKQGKKVIYDAHEDLPSQVFDKPYLPAWSRPIVSSLASRLERFYASRMTGIVTATPTIYNRFSQFHKTVETVCNYPKAGGESVSAYDGKPDEICYVGGIFKTRGIVELIRAMDKIPALLNLAGTYSPADLRNELIQMEAWKKVKEYGFVDREGVRTIYQRSRVGIVTLHPTSAYKDALPVKLFEYMQAGIPVVASNFPLWKEIVEGNECGICADPRNATEIADAVNRLLADPTLAEGMGNKGREAILKRYNWEVEEKKLTGFYNRVLKLPHL